MASRIVSIRAGESIFIDFLKQDGVAMDATMESDYVINDATGTEFSTGTLTKSVDDLTFELRVGSTETSTMTVQDYQLLVRVFDDTTGYADYIFEETVRVYE